MMFLLISLSTFYVYFVLKTNKAILLLEEEKYSVRKYFKSIFASPLKRFGLLELGFIILIIIDLATNEKVAGICTIIFYTALCLKEIKGRKKIKLTVNNVRVFIITLLLFVALNIPVIIDSFTYKNTFVSYNPMFIYYMILYIIMYLLWFIVGLAGCINTLFMKKKKKKK